jgi:hypothetical protein
LEQEKHELEVTLEQSIDGFSRERFHSIIWPENNQKTAQMLCDGQVYTFRGNGEFSHQARNTL